MANHLRWFSVILVASAVACNRDRPDAETPPAAQPALPPAAAPRELVSVPARKTDSISVEGTMIPMTMELIQPASSVPFMTYMPTDMIHELVSSGEGEGHYFYANFGGRRNDEAFLLFFIFPAGTAETDALRLARAFRDSRASGEYFVNVEVKMHNSRYYYIAEHYPLEYGDGFGPRAHRIQEEWRWLDAT